MRASYLMSGVATGLRRNASMTVALVLSTAIALFFLGGALLINKEIAKTQTAYKDKINVSIYLCTATSNQTPGSSCKHAVTDAERQALMLLLARLEYGRPYFLPPGVPAERVNALRRAFDATMKDKEFLADAEKLKLDVDPLTGEQVAALVEQVAHTAPETAARVRAALEAK